jgi:hypothetical protein
VRFVDGTVRTVRCHEVLGTYSAAINHDFMFTKTTSPLRSGCPGRQLAMSLMTATRVDVETKSGRDTMVIENGSGHAVATLRSGASTQR